jgi:hypothetical protein
MEKIIKEGHLMFSDSSAESSSSSHAQSLSNNQQQQRENPNASMHNDDHSQSTNHSSENGGGMIGLNDSSMSTVISTQELSTNPSEFVRRHNVNPFTMARLNSRNAANKNAANATGEQNWSNSQSANTRDEFAENNRYINL